jgi:hypothetical protein
MGFVADKPSSPGKFTPDKPDALSRENLERDLVNSNYRIPGTDVEVPFTKYVNQFLVSTGRGMVDLWAGANQLVRTGEDAARYTREQEEELALFEPMKREAPVLSTLGRVTGQVAPTLMVPAGAAAAGVRAAGRLPFLSFLSRAGAGTDAAIMGGLQGAMNFVPEGESRAANVVTGAAFGAGVTKGLEYGGRAAAPMVRRGINYIRDKVDDAVGRPNLQTMAGTAPAVTVDDVANALRAEGIDWSTLPSKVRETLMQQADEAARGGVPVTPAELARVARAEGLPGGGARLTKGQMTQNRQQLREEFNLRRTAVGQSLDDQLVAQDEALANSLDVIKLKTGGTTAAGRDAEAGRKITQPLIQQLRSQQAKVDQLYKVADEAGETLEKVNPEPLLRWLEDNFAAQHSAPAMRSLAAQLKKSGLVKFEDAGEGVIAVPGREITIREAEELRKAMNQWGKGNDASGHWMSEAKRVLDGITDGKGGDMYARARAARIALREQFEDPGIIHRLVGEKAGGDRLTAFEDVFRTSVLNSSVDDLTRLRGQLLSGGQGVTHDMGVQAFKDMRAAALDYLKLGALNNAKDEWSHAGFKRAVESIGPEKLEVLFGKNTANQIMSVLNSSADMKAVFNKAGIYNPGTASALVDWLDKITGIIGLGRAASYTTAAAKKVWEGMHGQKAVEAATKPVESAVKAGAAAKDEAYRRLIGLYGARTGAALAPGMTAAAVAPEVDER